jgi:DNA-binding CsgD family transcriptional regulator
MARSRPRVQSRARRERPLSGREKEIVRLVAQAYRNKEVAQKLSISEQPVKNHLYRIFAKLGVFDRRELRIYEIHS